MSTRAGLLNNASTLALNTNLRRTLGERENCLPSITFQSPQFTQEESDREEVPAPVGDYGAFSVVSFEPEQVLMSVAAIHRAPRGTWQIMPEGSAFETYEYPVGPSNFSIVPGGRSVKFKTDDFEVTFARPAFDASTTGPQFGYDKYLNGELSGPSIVLVHPPDETNVVLELTAESMRSSPATRRALWEKQFEARRSANGN